MYQAPLLPLQAPLVGRDAEWQHLGAVWKRAAAGQPRLLIVTGEAGIGKTRLVEEFIMWVRRQGATALMANSYASENDLAYAPVITWLRDPASARHRKQLETTWMSESMCLLPEVRVERHGIDEPLPLREAWQRQRLFEALARATLAGTAPLLLCLEDLQWCDNDTLEWLHFLLRFDSRARLLVIGTARSEELAQNNALRFLLDDQRHADRLSEIALEYLGTQ